MTQDHQGLSIRHSADWRGEAVVVHPTGEWMTIGEELVAGKFIAPPSVDVPSAVVVASVAVAARAHATSTFVAFFTTTDTRKSSLKQELSCTMIL